MIIYYKCSCTSRDKLKLAEYRKAGHEVRLLSNPKWRKEARLYSVSPPFKVIDEGNKIGAAL